MLSDSFGRRIDYLRVSVTDRCNLRCVYCLPEEFSRFAAGSELLSFAEQSELLACFAELGISKFRITGGEPLVRAGLASLIEAAAKLPGVEDLSLSTNGVLMAAQLPELKRAGLRRVNISLDSLDPEKFKRITRFGTLASVLEGIDAALAAGLAPVKLNVVVARGMNDDELGAFCALTEAKPLHVRFIELMPMGETGFFSSGRRVPLEEMRRHAGVLEELAGADRPKGFGPARYYRRPGAAGTIGFISALSCGFCSSCNRMRLSSTGMLFPCLDGGQGVDLGAAMRQGARRDEIKRLILGAVAAKPESHSMNERASTESGSSRFMCSVGG